MRPTKPYVPKNANDIMDLLGVMVLKSPSFIDKTGHFPDDDIDVIFRQLNDGLLLIRGKLGEGLYVKLSEMSDGMRAHFEADRDTRTDETLKGRAIIRDMMDLLKPCARQP
jgi:hypothetical protein